ncbi:MAG: hypothetical protein KDA41_10445, partial [Planctomycetales bacterium]|nr:hypothetical protein [Planctomycetales bacterium]
MTTTCAKKTKLTGGLFSRKPLVRATSVAVAAVLAATTWAVGSLAWADAYDSEIQFQNPLFYWNMNQGSGGNLAVTYDGSGPGVTSNPAIGASIVQGVTGGAALTSTGGFTGFSNSNSWFTFGGSTAT